MGIPGKKLKAFVKQNSKRAVEPREDEDDDETEGSEGSEEEGDETEGEEGGGEGGEKKGKDGKGKDGKPKKKPKIDLDKAASDADDRADDEIQDHLDDYEPDEDGNPPEWVTSEKTWSEAKKAVKPKWDSYEEPYAVVAYVYKQMGGTFKGKGGGDED